MYRSWFYAASPIFAKLQNQPDRSWGEPIGGSHRSSCVGDLAATCRAPQDGQARKSPPQNHVFQSGHLIGEA